MKAALYRLTACVALLCGLAPSGAGQTNPYLHRAAGDGTVRFALAERTKHPHFWWPRTLLNYHIVLPGPSAPVERWTLVDEGTGKPEPVQVSDIRKRGGTIVAATVSFFADLPTGGRRSFVLRTAAAGSTAGTEGHPLAGSEDAGIVFDTGVLKVRIPRSRPYAGGQKAPGPLMSVNEGKGWVGESFIDSPKKKVVRITTEILDQGPLFARARVGYDFDGGARYTATIKAARGSSFVELTEAFSGLSAGDQAMFRFLWTGLPLTHRGPEERIDQPRTLYFRGEDPHFTGPGSVEELSEAFYFRVGHCSADATISRTAAEFSHAGTGRTVGLAVLDGSKWDDGEYSIWAASDTQSVRFRYRNARLEWLLPLAGRSRQLGIAAYNQQDPAQHELLRRFGGEEDSASAQASLANRGVVNGNTMMALINSRYGGMSLDVIKDWRLEYPDTAPKSAGYQMPSNSRFAKTLASLAAYEKALWGDHEALHVEGNWFSPVSMRQMSQWIVPGYNQYRESMRADTRERATALLLFQSYLAAREEISPIRHMLGGHPNFMADWKYPLMAGAYLFPQHPMAHEWADQWEKFAELAGIFYVRPDVPAWDAKGGRWTENIGTYNWAFLEPLTRANELGLLFDGRDRLASAGMALHAEYLSGIVTAPLKLGSEGRPFEFRAGTPLTPEEGFQRVHPPQGAHSARRQIPGTVESLARSLSNYAPLIAEHLLWINRRPVGSFFGFEDISPAATEHFLALGTNPRLSSAKYTGYGVVLRAAVDTPDEIAVYLQQVDKGPNYRWGFGNENGGGDIYYYAAGNSYAGHLTEDAGDRHGTDAEVTSNTGVFKDSTFRGIGMNDLTEPFYDLGSAQFAEILARPGPDAYSWPEYEARSVMLVGHDYVVTFDTVNGPSRVSWNTVKGEDRMPNIIPMRGEVSYRTTQNTTVEGHRTVSSDSIRFEPYKGSGDRMMLVSHRDEVRRGTVNRRGQQAVVEVVLPEGRDYLYQQRSDFRSDEGGRVFSGRAGVIRERGNGSTELNLFRGALIGNRQMQLSVDNPSLGISAVFLKPDEVSGQFASRTGGNLTITFPGETPHGARIFVNGASVTMRADARSILVRLPPGAGRWQLTSGSTVPVAPEITRSLVTKDGVTVYFTAVASATGYRIERSRDGGSTWAAAGTSESAEFALRGGPAPEKLQLRVIALHGTTESRPGRDYPVYLTGKPAGPPAGLRLQLAKDSITATWGEVLGAGEYVLYRRESAQGEWKAVYRGTGRSWRDSVQGSIPAVAEPGLEADALRQPAERPVLREYAVAAVNGVGESGKSVSVTTDPASWRNWYPDTPLVFKRRSAYWMPPYVKPEQVPGAYYPK